MKQYSRSDMKDMRQEKSDMRQEKSDIDVRKQEDQIKKPDIMKDIIKGFLGKHVTINIRGKKLLKGVLESVSNYELLLTINSSPVIVMKHAVDYVELIDIS